MKAPEVVHQVMDVLVPVGVQRRLNSLSYNSHFGRGNSL